MNKFDIVLSNLKEYINNNYNKITIKSNNKKYKIVNGNIVSEK